MIDLRIGGFLFAAVLCFAPAHTLGATRTATNALDSKRLSFEPNLGQTAAEVEFVSRGKRSSLFLTRDRAVLSMLRGDRQLVLEMRFKNANLKGASRRSRPAARDGQLLPGRRPKQMAHLYPAVRQSPVPRHLSGYRSCVLRYEPSIGVRFHRLSGRRSACNPLGVCRSGQSPPRLQWRPGPRGG